MNIVNKVTIRHLKKNKRRTLVTIIGVIISVAMITAVATLWVSFLDLMIRQHISQYGEWHVHYKDVTTEQIEEIQQDSETNKLVLASDGYATLEHSKNKSKPYLFIQNYNDIGLEQFPINIVEGRLPQNENEVAISEAIIGNANIDYQIGNQLTIDIGDRFLQGDNKILDQTTPIQRNNQEIAEELRVHTTKQVQIVGKIKSPSWEPAWAPGYTVIGYVDRNHLPPKDRVDAYVTVKEIDGSIFTHAKKLSTSLGLEKPDFNSDLLRLYGVTANDQLRATLYSLAGIIISIIIIGSIALIYNAFAISVSERSRHLGMLSSIGATKKQKRNSVFFEGAVIGAISIPIGILAGITGIWITFKYINTFIENALSVSVGIVLTITPLSIMAAILISIATIFLSVYLPAMKASKTSAIDAIRQTNDIKITTKTVSTSRFIQKLFGIEAEIGIKNVKRHKLRYLATLFSLIISIVLFLSVTFFTDNLKKSLLLSQSDTQYDITLYGENLALDEIKDFANLKHVTKAIISEQVSVHVQTPVDQKHLSPQMKELLDDGILALQDGQYPYYVVLQSLDDASFTAFAKEIGANAQEYMNTEQPTAIVIDQITYEDGMTGKIIETKALEAEVGQVLDLYQSLITEEDNSEAKFEKFQSIKIGALTDKLPIGVESASLGGVNMIVSQSVMDTFTIGKTQHMYINSSDPIETQAAIDYQNDGTMQVYNVHKQREQEEQTLLLMSVFTYGFITLITLISVANIFNTISTSISLRKREFAMLRSVGMTPKGFKKMLHFETIYYGFNALVYGISISILVMLAIHKSVGSTFEYGFQIPWLNICIVICAILLIVGTAMIYATSRIRKENIIDGLKQENI